MRCGVDIIEISRIARAYRRRPQLFLKRFFTPEEQHQLAGRKHVEKHLAARFAGKEAVAKLLGTGIGPIGWREVEILTLAGGQPVVKLHGRAAHRAKDLFLGEISISLSHAREYAIAQAVAAVLTKL